MSKKSTSPDIHETLKTAAANLRAAKRARELAEVASERAQTAECAACEVERDAERAYTAARKAVAEAYPDVSRT